MKCLLFDKSKYKVIEANKKRKRVKTAIVRLKIDKYDSVGTKNRSC